MGNVKDKWNAKDYAKNSSAQEKWAVELIEKLALDGSEKVLDIGCGDGKITYRISRILSNGSVIGIDQSESMINLANNVFKNDNLSFVRMCATAISFDMKFDVAFSNAALHWVRDHKTVLKTLKNNLNSNARILFQMGGFGNAKELLEVMGTVTSSKAWEKYFRNFTFPYTFYRTVDYESWLPECGYKPERIELITKDLVHDNADDLKGWLRTTWFPYTNQLPVVDREKFLDDLVETYTSQYPVDSEGKTHINMVRLEVEAYAL